MAIRESTSSFLVALHEACSAVRSGSAKSAVVLGAAQNGAVGGEAVSAVYIKTLPDAMRRGNPIRAIIRASSIMTLSGRSSVAEAHEELIREAYDAAGLDIRSALVVEVGVTMT
jgi:acyl transferase domain-containing protein